MNQPSSELSRPEKNMKRQPQTAKASPGKTEDVIRKMKDASSAPMPAPPPPTRPDIAPRHCGGTDSVPMVWVDATTPPTKMPWISLRIRNMIGAITPTCAMVGSRPNAAVLRPTPTMAMSIACLRPCTSA
ncbi:hypothetical protein ACVI1J_007952 [Bradyrhizobium diazoefficiens]